MCHRALFQLGDDMSNKSCSALSILCLTLAMNAMMHDSAHSETPPPDQTDTGSGGGATSDPGGGAGNGGGDQKDGVGPQVSYPSCSVSVAPDWFPEGPPVDVLVIPVNDDVSSVTELYDTERNLVHVYAVKDVDTLERIPNSYESWTDRDALSGPISRPSFVCMWY
jgi:hypothetical protein